MDYQTADRLIELRKKNGYSQEELADRLNVSRQAVSKWERAESLPDTENLIALARLYNVTLDELVNGEKTSTVNGTKEKNTHTTAKPVGKKVLRIISFATLGLGALFVMIGLGFFLGFTIPESLDLKLAQNDSIAPVSAEVTSKIDTNIYSNDEYQYKIVFTWSEGQTERVGRSNPAYSEAEADALVGKTVLIRVDGNRAVLVDYQRSVLSIIGFVFIGAFGGLGILFIGAFAVMYILSRRPKSKT